MVVVVVEDVEEVVVVAFVVDDDAVVVVASVVSGSRRRRRPRPFFGHGMDGIVTRFMMPRIQCVVDAVVDVVGASVVASSLHISPLLSVVGDALSRPRLFLTQLTSILSRTQIE